ncbi:MAG: MFS transporter, partial [Bifidobacteriaceae bacterium]|nr:MFS transporter [Bifidobacteriaceae bacterium]
MKTHREILEILSGLLVAMFVANVSATIVANALPVITAHLGTAQRQYTWIVTATMLAQTASTPIWGKLADLFDKKKLLLVAIGLFSVGSLCAGAAANTGQLIAFRALQGLAMGAMLILIQTIIGTVIPPRQRGRYMAYTGAVIAVATVAGPLIGGFIVDTSWLGWRWCFWAAIPFALAAMVVLQWRLEVPPTRRRAPGESAGIDWLGATLITAAASDLLIWISFADHSFAWVSWQTGVMLGSTALLTVLFILVERKATNPIIPLPIIRERNTALAVIASIAVGVGMFGSAVFLGQYYQVARGYSPTAAGLMMVPMMAGVLIASVVVGRWISHVGVWKPFVVVGTLVLAGGSALMGTIGYSTSLVTIAIYGAICGLGVGMTMQNLVLAVQNSVPRRDVGAATASVNFFRTLGGTIG